MQPRWRECNPYGSNIVAAYLRRVVVQVQPSLVLVVTLPLPCLPAAPEPCVRDRIKEELACSRQRRRCERRSPATAAVRKPWTKARRKEGTRSDFPPFFPFFPPFFSHFSQFLGHDGNESDGSDGAGAPPPVDLTDEQMIEEPGADRGRAAPGTRRG